MTIIPIKRTGEQDGLRANALIVACPITATTIEGPMMAADMTRKSVTKTKDAAYLGLPEGTAWTSSGSSTRMTHLFS